MKIITGRSAIAEQAADLLTDESHFTQGVPEQVFFPESRDDILLAVDAARSGGRSITLVGGKNRYHRRIGAHGRVCCNLFLFNE